MKQPLLGILCIAVLLVILTLGLWPFHAPKNEVTWLRDQNGLRLGDHGTVMSAGALDGQESGVPQPCSIELSLQPADDYGGTVLTFYAPDNPIRLSVHQSLTDLMLQSGRPDSPGPARKQRIYFNDVFRQGRQVFLTITTGLQGTSVYLNGTLLKTARGFRLASADCTGRLIVGDGARQQDTWPGQVRGLAIYSSELAAPTVLRHYEAWTQKGQADADQNEQMVGLYLFDERAGHIVHNHAHSRADLFIPDTYTVLDEIFLEPFWDEFEMSWSYWKNILKNIVGFVPLGLCFCAYFAMVHKSKRAGLVTVIIGFAVSLTIEVLQGYLPSRDSGTTDLFTNTLGTWLGVVLFSAVRTQWDLRSRIQEADRSPD